MAKKSKSKGDISGSSTPTTISREERAHNVAVCLNSVIQSWDDEINKDETEFHLLDENFQGIWNEDTLYGKRIGDYDIECIVTQLRSLSNWKDRDLEEFFSLNFVQRQKIKDTTRSLLMRIVDFTKANPLGNKMLKSGIGLKSPKAKKLFDESESETEHSSPENQKPERQTSQLIRGERAKVNVSVEISSYSGQKGKARVFVRDFLGIMKAQRFDESQWDSLLHSCLKKDALRFFQNNRMIYSDFKEFFEEFIEFFDSRSVDNEYHWFREVLRQKDGQDFDTWFLFFQSKVQYMQSLDQYPQYSESSFNASFMRDLYCKLNKQCFAIVDKKLKDLRLEVKECSWKDFKNWIEEANLEEKNLFNFSNKKQPPRHSGNFQRNISEKKHHVDKNKENAKKQSAPVKSNQNNILATSSKQPFCHYCGVYGHWMKTRDKKTYTCPDALAKKPPCPSHQFWREQQGLGPNPFATMADVENKREVALTTSISFKGKQRWYNGLITFLDLGGCENVVNSQFARNELQLPIHMDDSKAAQQIQQAVNGNTFSFTEFVEVNCNFDGHKEKVKFFLIDNLLHSFLFGYPFFRQRGAIFNLNEPAVTLTSIASNPTIQLLSTSGNGTEMITFFTGCNSLFFTLAPDYTEEEAQAKLQDLLQEFNSIFDPSDKTSINAPEIDIPLKQ